MRLTTLLALGVLTALAIPGLAEGQCFRCDESTDYECAFGFESGWNSCHTEAQQCFVQGFCLDPTLMGLASRSVGTVTVHGVAVSNDTFVTIACNGSLAGVFYSAHSADAKRGRAARIILS